MCIEKELSDKSKYPIFARTAVTGYELASTVHELLRYYKWKKISIIWNNRYAYKKLYEELHSLYKEDILSAHLMEATSNYYVNKHHNLTRGYLKTISRKSKSKFLVFVFRKIVVNVSLFKNYVSALNYAILYHWSPSTLTENIKKPLVL